MIDLYIIFFYNKFIFTGKILKLYNKQGTSIIKANTIGNKTVQQNAINCSKRILGKEALTQMKVNIIIELFNPKLKPYNNPSIIGLLKKLPKYFSIKNNQESINNKLENIVSKIDSKTKESKNK